MDKFSSIDTYIKTFPNDVQEILQMIRQTIQASAPDATEAISYGMSTFKLNGKNLVHFALGSPTLVFIQPLVRGMSSKMNY